MYIYSIRAVSISSGLPMPSFLVSGQAAPAAARYKTCNYNCICQKTVRKHTFFTSNAKRSLQVCAPAKDTRKKFVYI